LGPDSFFAAEVAWQRDASCNGAPFDFSPDVESRKDLEQARTGWCNTCPVRTECLAYALVYRMTGYWGGTDTVTRRLLGYARNRVRCPACKSKALIKIPEGYEICQACGVSWRSEPIHRMEEAVG
jgi:transcription factor WhiB